MKLSASLQENEGSVSDHQETNIMIRHIKIQHKYNIGLTIFFRGIIDICGQEYIWVAVVPDNSESEVISSNFPEYIENEAKEEILAAIEGDY